LQKKKKTLSDWEKSCRERETPAERKKNLSEKPGGAGGQKKKDSWRGLGTVRRQTEFKRKVSVNTPGGQKFRYRKRENKR